VTVTFYKSVIAITRTTARRAGFLTENGKTRPKNADPE
jgi:hypothetical protein